MNTEWLKRNGVVVLSLVLFVGFLLFESWKLAEALKRRQAVEEELTAEQQRLQTMLSAKPFPSRDNLTLVRTDRTELENLYQELQEAAAHPVVVPDLTRVQFRALLSQKLRDLKEAADTASVVIPTQFAFGFDEYLGVLPPEDKQVLHTLTKQLLVIEKLSQTLFTNQVKTNQVKKLTSVKRETAREAEDAGKQTALYQTSEFSLEFECSAESLQRFLNHLARLEWFFIVKSIDLEVKKVTVETPAARGRAALATPVLLPQRGSRPLPSMPAEPWSEGDSDAAPTPPARPTFETVTNVKLRLDLVEVTGNSDKEKKRR